MAGFDSDDLYTVSAGTLITDYWNPFVIKHDNQSFYNWEQDNLPLHDLEERTNYLWEKLGWPTSSLPGMVLAVSSSIPSHLDVSCNFFLDVSSALKALPEVIRMPVCVEVCTSGNLGDLNLDNVRFEGDGALEIINRVGIRFIGANDSTLSSIVTNRNANVPQATSLVSSMDAYQKYTDTSCLLGSSNDIPFGTVGTTDGVSRGFLQVRERMRATDSHRPALLNDIIGTSMVHSTSPFKWKAIPIGVNRFAGSTVDDTAETLDLSVLGRDNAKGENVIEYDSPRGDEPIFIKTHIVNDETPVHGVLTNNYFRRVRISNCGGPIYLRSFVVDPAEQSQTGAYTYSHSYDEGILIENSNGITLENCGVMRARGCGLRLNSSRVDLRRGFASSRNYEVLGSTSRSEGSVGIQANNSTIEVKTDSYVSGGEYFFHVQHNDIGLELNNSLLTGGDSYKDTWLVTVADPTVLNFSHNKIGVKGKSSVISVDGLISTYTNLVGMRLQDTTFEIDGFNCDGNQDVGLELYNSNVIYGVNEWRVPLGSLPVYTDSDTSHFIPKAYQIAFAVNGQHISSYGSTFKPKRLSSRSYNYVDTLPIIVFKDHFGHDAFIDNFQNNTGTSLKPGVFLDNSDFELCHTKMFAPHTINLESAQLSRNGLHLYTNHNKGSLGQLIKAKNGSNVVFKGSSGGATFLVGHGQDGKVRDLKAISNIYVSDNSTCKLLGKTFIAQGGTAALAENNSTIYMGPLEDPDGSLAVSSWDLSNVENHANIEIHSSHDMLIANNKSTITMRDIGDYALIWSGSDVNPSASDYYTASSLTTPNLVTAGGGISTNYANIRDLSSFTSHGSLIMLPNSINSRGSDNEGVTSLIGISNAYYNNLHANTPDENNLEFNPVTPIGNGHHASVLLTSYSNLSEDEFIRGSSSPSLSGYEYGLSHGGVCVKAMNGSHVNCTNVHFVPGPTLTDKPFLDSPSLAENAAGCYNLRIWNFGKNSSFNSSFLSVSGNYPSVAPYWGPQSYHIKPGTTWYYGEGNHNTSAVAYTAFSSFEWQYDDDGTIRMESSNLGNTAVLDTFGDTCDASASPRFDHTLAQNRYKGNYLSSTGLSAFDQKAFDTDGSKPGLVGDQVYGMYGVDGPFNRGPFRFYFAIDPKASLLHYSDSDVTDKRPYQLLSQGYHLSGNCTAIDDDAPFSPSPYGVLNNLDLIQASGAGTGSFELAMSGYYHVSAFVDTTFKDRIIIDESTSNTFANAKHCSYTFDGRPPLLTIYRSNISPEGEMSLGTAGLGKGIRSVNIFDTGREH